MFDPLDPHLLWREQAAVLLRAIAGHFAPAETRLEDLQDVVDVLRQSPPLRAEVARIIELTWAGNDAEFGDFIWAMERAQRYDGSTYRDILHTLSRRRIDRDSIKATARALLQSAKS